ncbi:MAG: Rrf2 family transcriptional regulator [Planctomycetes bacterium]|nr:Rrf2 family transcriptional regulator [Planctomycetota bacterium]
MFSLTSEYAMRAMVYLAERESGTQVTHEIAEATQVPAGYLAKVLQALSRAGLVTGSRGLHGGFRLAKPAEKITLFDILEAVDPLPRIRKCPLDNPAHGVNLCPLHRRLDDALEIVEKALRDSTVAEMLKSGGGRKSTCTFPVVSDEAIKA